MDDGTPHPDRELPSIRASDSEREATVQILQESYAEGRLSLAEFDERTTQAYGARFRSELAELTRDLAIGHQHLDIHRAPAPPHPRDPGESPGGVPVRRVSGQTGPSTSLAVMSGCERGGHWTVSDGHTAVAVMGGVELDLRRADLQTHYVTIRAFAFMGGIEIVVPDDVHLEIDGLGVMGYFGEESDDSDTDDHRLVRQAPPGAPRLRVTGLAVWAGVSVRRVPSD